MPLLRHCARSFRIVLTVWLSVRSDFQCCPPTFANMYKVMPDVSIIIIQIVNGVNHANVRKAPACFWSRHHTSHSTLRSLKISNRKQQTHYRRDQSSFCLLHALLYVSPAISISAHVWPAWSCCTRLLTRVCSWCSPNPSRWSQCKPDMVP